MVTSALSDAGANTFWSTNSCLSEGSVSAQQHREDGIEGSRRLLNQRSAEQHAQLALVAYLQFRRARLIGEGKHIPGVAPHLEQTIRFIAPCRQRARLRLRSQ